MPTNIKRVRIIFRGVVQGVGFRPAVYRCAVACDLAGFVQNRRSEVVAELQGGEAAIARFEELMRQNLPAPARVESREVEEIDAVAAEGFRILESTSSRYIFPPIPPDLALCERCRLELLDPSNRRYLYPFITCTECGPRFSIVEDTPFDRERTSMVDFPQCARCAGEYRDPADRRFHSQTNSCPDCGPTLHLQAGDGTPVEGDPLVATIEALARGRVVALQGIGGFHLAADPRFPEAVARLRREKTRGRKPFALMVRDLAEAQALCLVPEEARSLLQSAASPIAILPAAERIPEHLATVSDLGTLGLMLPYSPLHYLLFFHPDADIPYRHLVMTSGNRGDEPIITDPAEARQELATTADLFLSHDRRILFATDDSVVRLAGADAPDRHRVTATPEDCRTQDTAFARESDAPSLACFVRRSRGFVPEVVRLSKPVDLSTLAAGSDLKSAPALALEDMVLLAPHLGDLEEPASRASYVRTVERMLTLYDLSPQRIVYDLHPAYFSSTWAVGSPIARKVGLQHHYAHLLSVMAEHGLEESIGVAFDGTGYGTDGTIWGGEFLHATRSSFTRLGSFRPFALPGGDEAIRHPARIAFSLLHGEGAGDSVPNLSEAERALVAEMIERSLNAPLTSSAGRLFDAAAALLGLVREVSYEGEGPMKLETLAAQGQRRGDARPETLAELLPIVAPVPAESRSAAGGAEVARLAGKARPAGSAPTGSPPARQPNPGGDGSPQSFLVDPRPLLVRIAASREREEPEGLALLFHQSIADAIVRGALHMRDETGVRTLVLSGGVFQNLLLRALVVPPLAREGFDLRWNRSVPPGDGGIAVGQAWYAGGG